MRVLWTLLKVIIGLAIAIPLGIAGLAITFGILAGLLGLAIVALKLACVAFVGYGLFKLVGHMFGGSSSPKTPVRQLPAVDPYYEAAMRELDTEMRVR